MDTVISVTFVVGSALAAIGGLLIASHIGQINFAIGFIAGIKAFTAAVLGGIGSIPGAVLGSFVLGLTESFATGYVSSDYEDVFAFSLLVLILIFRPAGLLGGESLARPPSKCWSMKPVCRLPSANSCRQSTRVTKSMFVLTPSMW